MAKIMKKAQSGKSMKVVPISDSAFKARETERKLFSGNPLFKKASAMKDTTTYKKAQKGKSFPDLNKDGKITKADILKGRGVIAKKGAKMKMGGAMAKQAAIAIAMKKAGKTPKKKMQYGGEAASMVPTMKKGGKAMYGKSMMSKGGKMKMGGKCKNGC
jgi:hypothetical protein